MEAKKNQKSKAVKTHEFWITQHCIRINTSKLYLVAVWTRSTHFANQDLTHGGSTSPVLSAEPAAFDGRPQTVKRKRWGSQEARQAAPIEHEIQRARSSLIQFVHLPENTVDVITSQNATSHCHVPLQTCPLHPPHPFDWSIVPLHHPWRIRVGSLAKQSLFGSSCSS